MKNSLKKIFGIGLISLVTLFYSPKSFKSEEFLNVPIKNFIEKFPIKIPESLSIKKYYVPGSKYCLIHIRQIHYSLGLRVNTLQEVENIQKNIYKNLEFLIKKIGIKSIHIESLTENGDPFTETFKTYFKINLSAGPGYKYIGGASRKMVLEGKLNAIPGEEFSKFQNVIECLKNTYVKKSESIYQKCLDVIIETREDVLLKLIANKEEKIAVTVYGGAHAWGGKKSCGKNYSLEGRISYRDNIYEWNKSFPNKKFSLIEITPKGYDY